jgi:alginate O-acetyltransferase complex protein AlgI
MLFNSIDFAIFLPIVFILYWYVTNKNLKLQNLLIVASSLLFYGWWDWRFLSLLLFSSIVDYFVGLGLSRESDDSKRKILLWVTLTVNLGLLGFFKYFNFFVDSFITAFSFFGVEFKARSLNIILPVGISFYTFQTMSYTIDVYKRMLKPTKDFVAFLAFVSFFPQLVAGPIERAANLLPQFYRKRTFKYEEASMGCKMMLWGLFMKVGVADRLSLYVDEVYSNIDMHSGPTLMLATIFFAIQIYCDFGGYSLIAIGCAKLFDFDLMRNFNRPYLAGSFKDFWSRWHISLSSWFRDYLYIPLGGSRKGKVRTNINLLVTFIVSGFWHGANWTFIIWGTLHGLYLVVEKSLSNIKVPKVIAIFNVFVLTNFAWIFFRASSTSEAFKIIGKIFTPSRNPLYLGDKGIFFFSILSILILLLHDIMAEFKPRIELFNNERVIVRYSSILFLIIYTIAVGVFDNSQFIYFQF